MSNIEKLKRFLSLFCRTSKVLVLINADPDSIASGMAVKRIFWRKVYEVSIAYFNKMTRPDNLTMIELTDSGIQFLTR
jgi:nanoRNase/pAp phosphatase (c-di-AMP/oligoRNAs hydrolase)